MKIVNIVSLHLMLLIDSATLSRHVMNQFYMG